MKIFQKSKKKESLTLYKCVYPELKKKKSELKIENCLDFLQEQRLHLIVVEKCSNKIHYY